MSHSEHESHGAHSDSHGEHGHSHGHEHGHKHGDKHAHEHGHGEPVWGDYNAQEAEPSTLPTVSPLSLLMFGLALGALLFSIAFFGLRLGSHESNEVEAPAESHG